MSFHILSSGVRFQSIAVPYRYDVGRLRCVMDDVLSDGDIAANLRKARELAGLSQDHVASGMRERGHAYHRTTVYKIESSVRKVPAVELPALADVLDTTIDELLAVPRAHDRVFVLHMADVEEEELEEEVARSIRAWMRALTDLNELADSWLDDPSEDVQAMIRTVRSYPEWPEDFLMGVLKDFRESPDDDEEFESDELEEAADVTEPGARKLTPVRDVPRG